MGKWIELLSGCSEKLKKKFRTRRVALQIEKETFSSSCGYHKLQPPLL